MTMNKQKDKIGNVPQDTQVLSWDQTDGRLVWKNDPNNIVRRAVKWDGGRYAVPEEIGVDVADEPDKMAKIIIKPDGTWEKVE